jgi:hypothetical protein
MTPDDARALEHAWGDKPCDHPDIIAEHAGGNDGGTWRCTQCGKVCDYDEWMKSSGLSE